MGRGASRESGSQLTFSQLRVRVRRSELTFSQVSPQPRICAVWHSAWAMASTSFGAAGSSRYRDLEDLR